MTIGDTEKAIIRLIQGDLPVHPQPFKVMAEAVGISEEAFIASVKRLKEKGIIRRFGATLRHQEAGFSANAMVAWRVPEAHIDAAGQKLAKVKAVSHCYYRAPQGDWPYTLYTMVHGETREACYRIAEGLSRETGIDDYVLLFSEKEFKKTSMEYF